jgi:multiple sugar transport system substrate-binding protein
MHQSQQEDSVKEPNRNSMSRRQFLRGVGAGAAASALLAACGGAATPAGTGGQTPQSGAEATAAPATSGRVTIRHHSRIGTQGDYYKEMAEKFNTSQDKITVTVEDFPGTDPEYLQKISTMISGGTIGDTMWMASIHNYYNYAGAGVYLPLDDLIKGESYDLSPFYKVGLDNATVNGQLFGLPWIVHPGRTGLWYNKTLMEAAGQALPTADWTYDDLITAGKALTKAEGGNTTQWGFFPENDYFGLAIPIRSFGGDWLSADGTKVTVNEEKAVAGLTTYESIYQQHKIAPTPAELQGQPYGGVFVSGKTGMWQSGYWGQAVIAGGANDAFEWGVVPMPKGPNGSQGMFEFDANVIMATTKQPQAAWEWLKFCSTKEAGVRIAELGSVPGARQDVWNDPTLMSKPYHVVFKDIMENIMPLVMPKNGRSAEMASAVTNILTPVWDGTAQLASVIETLTSNLQEIVDKPAL